MADNNTNRLEEVKNLIFGEDIEGYNSQIGEIKKLISENKADLTEKVTEVKNSLLEAIKNAEQTLNNKLETIQQAAQEELDKQKQDYVNKENLSATMSQIAEALKA